MTLRFRHLLIAFFALLCCCNAAAQTKLFVVNGQTISLERAENSVGVFLRAFRPNLATSRWDVDVTVTNGSTRTLKTPLILRFDTAVQISPGVVGASLDADGLPYLDISGLATAGDFVPGQALRTFTMSFGDGRTKPTIAIGIYSQPQTPLVNLAALQVLTADGAPLEGVTAEEIGPAQPRSFSGGRGGWFSLEVSPGVRGWRFSASGRAPVVRLAPSVADRVTELSSPRLVKLSSDGRTTFSAATIPAPIPAGWSPLAAAFLQTGTSILDLNETLENGAVAVLARWDDAAVSWRTVQIVNGTGSKNVSVDVSDAGVFAVLRADQAPVTPSSPIVGGIVRGISVTAPATLTATGLANPASRTASSDPALVQTEAVVELASSAGALSSGLSIPCEITEEYQLRDGTHRILPSYRMIVVGYQRPRGTNAGSLVGRFPLRPFQLLTGEKLAEAIVRVQVIRPGGFVGEVFENNGGSLTHGSVRVAATSGDFARPEAVILQESSLPPTNGIAPAELEVARAFELSVSSTENSRKLGLTFGPQAPNKTYVLARAVFDEGRHGFQPVQRFVTGADGILHSTEPATDGLVGVDGGGQFVLFQTTGPEAVVSGVARDSNGQAKRGLTVRRGPWTAFSDGTGAFRLLAPSGASEVTAVDPTTGDTGSNSIQIAADLAPAQTTVDSAARGPRIISISPSNNATNVPRVVAVVINFNKPVNPTTIVGGGVQLLNSTNGVVTAPLTLNLAGDTVTVLPVSPLASGEIYRVRVADTVTDLFSRPVEGDREFTFTTAVDTFVRGAAAEIIIFEPGATNLTAEILQKIPAYDPARDRDGVVIQGSQGTAEPRAKVILLNESTDETATTLADADGSFVSTVHGSVQDFISAIVVNANGTQNRIPATRQKFDDGSVGLFGAGGTITSSGPGAPVDLIVDPGSVHGRTVFKIDTITPDSFQQLMNGKLPAGARAPLGAFQLTESADPLGAPAHISMPVKLADLGLPAGSNPTNFSFVVTRAVIFDGKPVHQIVDMATYEPTGPEGGRVRTQSPPFVGMLARRLADLAKTAGLSPANSVVTASSSGNPHQGTTAAYGILPVDQATAGLRVGGFVRAVTKHDDGSETVAPLGGAIVRVFHPEDEDDPGDPNVVYEGDLVSISDERGEFGFFFKPVVADMSRQMVATHARFPFQKPRSGPFSADRAGANVVRTELRFTELPQVVVASDGVQKPVVTVGHDPALPPAGTGPNDGATVFVTAVDDKVVSVPLLTVTEVQDLQGDPLPFGTVTVSAVPPTEDKPGRKVREFHVTMKQPGRAMFEASASDGMTGTIFTQHAISFGAGRVLPPPDPNDSVPMRVIFAWPPPGGTNVPNLMPITLRFNKPVRSGLLAQAQPDWITFTSGHFVRRVTPTPDRREITVFYDGPSTGPVQMVVGPGLMGDTGGPFDQNTLEAGTQSFEVQFTQTAGVSQELDGDAGAGVVMLGRFGYVLERKFVGSQPVGTLRVLDFEDPGEPEETQSVRIRYPTAMSLIANYAMRNANGDCETNNMLALFSGTANEPKFLQLAKLAGGEVTLGPKLVLSGGGTDGEGHRSVAINSTIAESQSQIVRSRWDPPYLAYFELGADVTSVKLINLASFQQVALKDGILDSFPVGQGNDGTDVNGDGDFCDNDDGDVPPKPDGDPLIPPGLAFSVTPKNARERIIDFDFNSGLGVIFSISSFIAEESRPRFSTLLSAGEASLLDTAFVEFASGDSPRRMLFLPAVTLQTPTNRIVRDIAVVSLGQASGDGALAVIDVSTPSTPTLLNRFTLPLGEGTPASIQKRDDGLLAVTTTHSTLLVDPTKLTASNQSATHPSIVGRIDASGTGVRDFVADPTGINITYGGESRKYLETAPKFSFVRFDTNKVINPNRIADLSSPEIAEFLKIAAPLDAAEVTPAPNGSAPGLDPSRHYYVLADIPGGAADSSGKLALVLSAVDSSGMPQVELGGTVVPAVVGDEQLDSALLSRRVIDVLFVLTKVKKAGQGVLQAATIAQKIRAGLGSLKTIKRAIQKLGALGRMLKLMPDKFEARRLSNNPDDPLYNKFLAGPFIVLGGVPTLDDMKALKAQADSLQVDRAYLRPSPRLWVGLPSQRVPTLFSLQPVNPFGPPESKLKPFVSELRLNPNAAIAGISVPHSREIIEQIATLNGLPTSPTSSLDFIQQITLVVSMLNNLPFFGAVVSGDWKPMLVPGAHGMLRVNFNERPVIFVPGFAGSQLEIHNQNRWLGLPNALVDRERAFLRVNPDGTPVEPTFATDAVRFALETSVINLQSIYGDWLEHLSDELGLVEYDYRKAGGSFQLSGEQIQRMLGFGPEANFSQTPIPSLYVFPYDWRLDNDIAARKLKDYVRLALEMHPDADGIDLVAHSNGGLVSRAYMLLPGQTPLVKRFITVGTPWLGAPKALAALRTGDIDETSMSVLAPLPAVRKMLQFSPGAHQLLPSKEYFDLGFRPLIEDGFDIDTNGLPNEAFTYDRYTNALAKHFLRKPAEELGWTLASLDGAHPVAANIRKFRDTKPIGDHSQDINDVEVHHIFGMGATADTIGQIRVRARLVSETNKTNVTVSLARVASRETEQVRDGPDTLISLGDGNLAVSETNQFRMSEELEVRYVAGDGTVPIASLVRGFGSERNLNAPKAQLHPIVGGFDDDFTGHNPMLNSPEFFDIFDRIYVGRKITNIDLSITANNLSEGSLGTIDVILNGLPPAESGAEISYVVDFGDGGVELKNGGIESVTFQHRYRQSGDYMITAAASGGNESYGVTSKFVHVTNEPPQVTIVGLTDTVNLGESRIAIAKVNDPGLDDRHTFVWSVGGAVASGLNQFAVPLTFNTPGQQIVKVVVTDSDGAQVETPFTVNVRSTASSTADANFGPDPAAQAPLIAQAPPIAGFQGGHPEIIVRFHGHAPSSFGTVGLSDKQEGIGSAIGDAAAAIAFGGVFDLIGPVALDQIILPGAARFMGQLAQDSEYVRLERELPSEVASIDIAATRALVGARGNDRPVEVDVLYIEGGKPKNLYRWVVPKVAATEGLRMTFRWIPEPSVSDATLERVAADTVTSPLRASAIETIPPIFVGDGEQKAGDRSGPATLGILNPATEQIRILARDNLTVESKISLFAVFDANENGRFDDDIFYPLDTNVVSYARLPKRPFAIVGVDEQGNVGGLDPFTLEETHNFLVDKNPNEQLSEYEKKLNEVRAAVRGAITDGFSSPDIVTKYLLKPSHLWVFEQGSGANLWKADYVQRCNGIYIPGKSDNDYELILPVFLENEYQFNEQERQRFVNAGPHEEATLRGDWYFKRPTGIDVAGNQTDDIQAVFEWQFDIPAGFLFEGQNTFRVPRTADDENLAVGFHSPLTPAEIIARVFTQQITRNGSRRKALPDTTFFPERREHFMFGQLHLERPPAFGDDPIGDAGTGRQMLMLKWLMEGAYVTPDDSTTGPGSNFSQGAPTLASIYANWKQAGVPLAEGFEWGVFQDFAALKSRPFQVLSVRLSNHGTTDSPRLVRRFYDDAALEQQASRIKKLGKAAIRAALARLAGDNNLNPLVAGVSIDTVINNPARSFEDFILKQARSSDDAKAAFGAFAQDRDDVKDPPDLGDFLRAKNADRNYLQTILTTPGSYERFVTTTFQFLRTVVQTPTRPTYGAYTNTLQLGGKFSELLQRSENLNFVLQGRGSTQPGLLALNTDRRISRTPIPIGVEVYSPGAVGQINISLDHSEDDPAPAPPSGKKKQSLAQADNLQTTIDGAPDEDETVADGENAAEGSAEINPFDEPTIITEISAVTGSAIDPTQEDNTVVVDATAIDPAIPAPAVSSDPIVFVSIRPAGDESVFQLEDWPAIGNRPQSPRYLLRQTDKLEIQLLAAGGLPPFVATVISESDTAGRIVLLEDRSDIGSYDNLSAANVIQFRHTTDPLPNRIYVKDEEILTIRITGNDVDKEIKVMVDLGEMSLATLQHHDRPLSQKPRFDYVKQFLDLDPENHDSFKFFTGGFTEFNDSIATLAGGGANDMQKFIQHFADPTPLFASMGEADILYVHAHGAGDGRLGEHISNSDTNGTRQTILRPSADLTTPGFWRSDAEWAILDACLTLNTIVSGGASQPGRINWEGVLANVNGGPGRRFPHGILGFERTKPAARSPHLAFMGLLQRGFRFVDAWQISMDSFNQPWAALYYRSAVADTVREISQDPGVGDAIDYQESTGFFSDFDCEECDSESPTFRPFDEIGTLPLEHAPENWAQAENALRSCGYDPNDFWQLGVSEESSIQISGAIASERRIVAQSYHLQKALGEDDARVVVRIERDGRVRVLDVAQLLRSGGQR